MPEDLTCPFCDQTTPVPENLLGGKVYCPACGAAFTASRRPPDREPAPFMTEDGFGPRQPRPAARGGGHLDADAPGWWSARAGLRLQGWAHLLYLVAVGVTALLLLAVLVEGGGRHRDSEAVLVVLSVALALLCLATLILSFVAGCFLVLTPNRRRARALAIATTIWTGIMLLRALGATPYVMEHGDPFFGPRSAAIGLPVMEVVRMTLLACLLHAMARALRSEAAGMAGTLIVLTPVLPAGVLLVGIVMAVGQAGAGGWVVVSVLGVGGLAAILGVGMVAMVKLRHLITSRFGEPDD
jgi:hypothetical protein